MEAPSEGRAHLVPIQFIPLSVVFAKADLLPAVLDAFQLSYSLPGWRWYKSHSEDAEPESFLTLMGEEEQERLRRGES